MTRRQRISIAGLAALAGVALGLYAKSFWLPGVDGRLIVGDLAVGWLFVGGGLAASLGLPRSRAGLLMVAVGVAWFAGTISPTLAFLHRGPLFHLLATYPSGRLVRGGPDASRVVVGQVVLVGAVYIASAMPPSSLSDATGIIEAVAFAGLAGLTVLLPRGARWRPAAVSSFAGFGIASVLAVRAYAHLAGSPVGALVFVYEAVLAAAAVVLILDMVARRRAEGVLANVVVDLGEAADGGTVRERLARAVGDPTLVVGYGVDGRPDEFVDEAGRPIPAPTPAAGRVITPIAIGGQRTAVIAHDAAVLDDPRVVASIAAAAELAMSNSALQADFRARVDDVAASRERLVGAADAQRRRLERLLQAGAARRLARVSELISELQQRRPTDARIAEIRDDLVHARAELGDLARGIHPAVLTTGGLAAALADLVRRSPLPVTLSIAEDGGHIEADPLVESTLYFVASEAIANAAKHAGARSMSIDVRRSGADVRLAVVDDGVGGAALGMRGGLRGLADRVEALGGRLQIDSPAGSGTKLVAALAGWPARAVAK